MPHSDRLLGVLLVSFWFKHFPKCIHTNHYPNLLATAAKFLLLIIWVYVESSPVTTDSLVSAEALLISCSTHSTKLLFFTKAVVIVVIFDLVSSIARNWTYAWEYIWANTPFPFLPQSSMHKKVGGGGGGAYFFSSKKFMHCCPFLQYPTSADKRR